VPDIETGAYPHLKLPPPFPSYTSHIHVY
jgi:hypothetical protein